MSRIVKSIVDSLFGSANADLHMVCRCAACTNSGKMDERHAVCGSRNAAFVAKMKSTYLRHRSDSTLVRPLDRTDCRPVHFQRKVRARLIVILNMRGENASQVFFVEDDDLVQAFTPDTAIQSLRVWILPRALRSGEYLFDTHVPHSPSKPFPVDGVAVAQKE